MSLILSELFYFVW